MSKEAFNDPNPSTVPITLEGVGNLTERERAFVEAYLRLGVGSHAALEAGVPKASSRSWASRTLRKPQVVEALTKAQQKISQTFHIDRNWVLFRLVQIVNAGMQKRPIVDMSNKPQFALDDPDKQLYRLVDAQSARSALLDIANLLGMVKTKEASDNAGVLLVQDLDTIEDWDEKNAGD